MSDIDKKQVATPLYDKLRPRHQLFLDGYIVRMVLAEGSRHANYKGNHKVLSERGRQIVQRPEVQAAFDELMLVKRAEHEDSKAALVEMLKLQVTVTLHDLARWCDAENKWVLKTPKEVDPQWLPVIHLATLTRERDVVINTGFQAKALKSLESLMMWQQDFKAPPASVSFDFGSLKPTTYEHVKEPIPEPKG